MEIEKEFDSAGLTLRGSLRVAEIPDVDSTTQGKQPNPLVLILPGSGELDRNANGARIQLNIYNSLAEQLAESGVSSFRYDKRGCAQSDGSFQETGFYDLLDDARSCLAALPNFEEVQGAPVFLLGHSEGTLIASLLSIENPDTNGQILITPFLSSIEKTIERQMQSTLAELKQLPGIKGFMVRIFLTVGGNQLTKQRRIMERVKRSRTDTIKVKKTVVNAKWLREHMEIDPAKIHSQVKVATLSIGGEKDMQCLPEDSEKIAELIKAPVDAHLLTDLTHILRPDEKPASTFRYTELAREPVDTRICELVATWVKQKQSGTKIST